MDILKSMGKPWIPMTLLGLAVLTVLVSLFGGDGMPEVSTLRKALLLQQEQNRELGEKVHNLRRELKDITRTDRGLEKAARSELGLARPDEKVFFFEEDE